MSRDERAIKIATVALHLAQQDKLREAAGYVERLNGSNGLVDAILGWIDTYMARCHPDHRMGEPIRILWHHSPTSETQTADEVQPAMRWAGRLIAARAADDEAAFYALLKSLPEGAALGRGIMALLHGVAHSLNNPELTRLSGESS